MEFTVEELNVIIVEMLRENERMFWGFNPGDMQATGYCMYCKRAIVVGSSAEPHRPHAPNCEGQQRLAVAVKAMQIRSERKV